jgi:hypothetical protein
MRRVLLSDDEVAARLRACFKEYGDRTVTIDLDVDALAELNQLERSLLRVIPTFTHLLSRHKIELQPLLERLRDHRLRWRFTNPAWLFDKRTTEDFRKMPKILDAAARFLEDGGALFVARSTSWVSERFGEALRGRSIDWDALSSADYEEIERIGLEMDGGIARQRSAISKDEAQLEALVANQSQVAALLLRRTAAKVRLLPWRKVTDDRGHRIFKAGPRRKQVIEATAARDLVSFFRREAGRALYDHVGRLLWATFPTLADWQSMHGEKRLRDHVKQLLRR